MFETGRTYSIKTIGLHEGAWGERISVWTVAAVDGSLIQLRSRHGRGLILNTASWHFVSAELIEGRQEDEEVPVFIASDFSSFRT